MDCFRISNLSFSYPHESNFALKNINLTIRQGEFVVLCGKSGCGKTTLLKMLKPELTPKGALHGEIVLFGKIKEHFSLRESAEKIGYLVQNTEYGTVTHSVRAELAFGLENLGCHSKLIRLRMAEIATYFALDDMLDKETSVLSGGQKQLLCLAAVVAMHPRVILLDEPVSQLDPVAAAAFLDAAKKLCTENGITIVMAEHRLENAIALADRLVVMEQGEIIGDCHPRNLAENLLCGNVFVRAAAPVAMKLHARLHCNGEMPLHVAEGQRMLLQMFGKEPQYTIPAVSPSTHSDKNAVRMKNVRFAYSAVGYVLKNLELTVKQGTFTALMGANGTGKTTALLLMCGILECKAGKIELLGKNIKKYKADELYNGTVALLPQKCESLFAGNCVREDLDFVLRNAGVKKEERQKRIAEVAEFAEISALLHKHPYDLSGGELQRAALAMVLLKRPKILFLDEPTKGMDALFKQKFAEKISQLCACGLTVVMVSHDAEFCAQYCDECALIFDGECILQSNRYDFFAQNYFYTTAANKLARDLFPTAVTYEQVLELCKKNLQN